MINAIAIDDEPLALKVISSLCDKHTDISLLKTFTQPGEALKYLKKFPVNLIFCDIHMPSITGITLVEQLPRNIMVIFTTAFSKYAVTSYDLNAIDYLLKPINQKRFDKAIDKARDFLAYQDKKNHSGDTSIFVRADLSLMKISLTDILYVEGLADYLKIHIKNRKTVVTRMSMKEMAEKLPSANFIRVHRSYILPFNAIEAVKGTTIYIGEQEFPVGKTYAADFFERYSNK